MRYACIAAVCAFVSPGAIATAQSRPADIDSLVARALVVSPALIAARHRVDAARARIGPAGARPDPTLMAGLENQPIGREGSATPVHGIVS